tara:strand:+ start:10449 stop:12614 length:2166 start_codon:yes stop_codon:yes gene_type:complete
MDFPKQPSLPPVRNPGANSDSSGVALAAEDIFEGSLVSIEGVAVQFGLVPIDLLREACTADAERLVRLLGRSPRTESPWLPVSTLGPLLVIAHHNPKCEDIWGVPDFLVVKVVVSLQQYENLKADMVMRITGMPIDESNEFEHVQRPENESGDLRGAFDWFIEHYPLEKQQAEQLRTSYRELVEKNPDPSVSEFNGLQKHLGVALYSIGSSTPVLVFNPDEAPRQEMFPMALLDKHGVYPLYCGRQRVYLLTENLDVYPFEDEWLSSGSDPIEMVPVLADDKVIRHAIAKYSGAKDGFEIDIKESDFEVSDDANLVEIIPEDILLVNPKNVNHTPDEIVKWVLYQALNLRASDLHLEKYYNTVRFRARIDGQLKVIFAASEELLPRYVAMIKNYSNLGQSRQEAQDGRFGMSIGKRRIDVRVAAVPCRGEFQKIIMRFLDKDGGMIALGDLNLSQRQSTLFDGAMCRDQGLVLITGPTGSGKTTTLYALLNSINEDHINIHTIEDPIEYRIEGLNQTQIDHVNNISFLTGLRALLRSDPDVILIGECRDEETATAAVTSALTGHLVLTTLHANDSLRAISRLLSMGVPNYLLADSLVLSQAQRLVRRLCNYCKRPVAMTEDILEPMVRFGIADGNVSTPVYTKVGCDECHHTGYKGRVALMEIAEINAEVKDMISEDAPMREIRKNARHNGLLSLYQEGLIQVLQGTTTIEEIKGLAYGSA